MVNLHVHWKDVDNQEHKRIFVSNILWTNTDDDVVGYWLQDQPDLSARFVHEHRRHGCADTHLSVKYIAYGRNIELCLCHNDEYLVIRLSIHIDGDVMFHLSSKSADGLFRERYYDNTEFDENLDIEFETELIPEYYDKTIIGFSRDLYS